MCTPTRFEPGDECPECSRALVGDACPCGWRVATRAPAPSTCVDCGTTGKLELDEDAQLRCAACHVLYLRRRAAQDPIDAEARERCRADIEARLGRGVLGAPNLEGEADPRRETRSPFRPPPGVESGGSHPEN